MIRFPLFWQSKNKPPKLKRDNIESIYLKGFEAGFLKAIDMHPIISDKIMEKVRDQAVDEAVRRLNGV